MSFRQGQHDRLQFVAPSGMFNTTTAPQRLKAEQYWQDVENMLPVRAGTLAKRFGTETQGVYDWDANAVILAKGEYIKDDGTVEIWVYTDNGTTRRLSLYDEGATPPLDFIPTVTLAGGTGDGLPFFGNFNGQLVFYNGRITPLIYDGSSWTNMSSFQKQVGASNLAYVDSNTITLDDPLLTSVGVGKRVRVDFATSGEITATVTSSSYLDPTLTINVSGTPFPNEVVEAVWIEVDVPKFRYIHQANDRLWALGEGIYAPKAYVSGEDRMFVYFTDLTNSNTGWHNDTTGEIGFINTTAKHGMPDSLMTISDYMGYMVFQGQKVTQIWGGYDPTDATDFAWQRNLPLGTVHPKLLQTFPNDLVFVSRYGLRQLSVVFQTSQVETSADLGKAVDTLFDSQVTLLMDSDAADYRRARSFFYPKGGFYGFRLSSETLVFAIQEEQKGFVRFTQDFRNMTSALSSIEDRLFVAVDNALKLYADGDTPSYAEDGEDMYIQGWTPWVQLSGKRFKGYYLQLMVTSETVGVDLYVDRFIDNDINVVKSNLLTLSPPLAFWDEALWDIAFWDGSVRIPYTTDRFNCYSLSYRIRNLSQSGPIELVSIDAFGEMEK